MPRILGKTDAARRSPVPELVALVVDCGVCPEAKGRTPGPARAGSVIKQWLRLTSPEVCREVIVGCGELAKRSPLTILAAHCRGETGNDVWARAREAYHEKRKREQERPATVDRYAQPQAPQSIGAIMAEAMRRAS